VFAKDSRHYARQARLLGKWLVERGTNDVIFIVRKVPLTSGNLVLDCPVPTKYLAAVPRKGLEPEDKEFTHMRYTAATCDPADFVAQNYTLRQALLGRSTELFIVMVSLLSTLGVLGVFFSNTSP
jgi:hypothetical protein